MNLKGNLVHHRLPLNELVNSRYVDVIIRMNKGGKLDLLYDGKVIAYQVQTPFTPVSGGRFGFGAYAGGQNAFHGLDDLQIETTALSGGTYITSLSPLGNNNSARPEISVTIADQDTALDPTSVVLELNDSPVTPTISRDELMFTTTLSYVVPQLLPALSQNTITVAWTDTAGTRQTNSSTFRVGDYTTLPASLALPVGAGVSTDSGFKVKIYQIQTNLTANSAFAESILAGQRGDNVAETTFADENGYFVEPSMTSTANFDLNSAPLGLSTFPGIPGLTDSEENFVAEILAYVEIPAAGFYRMGVRTDDGFVLKAGHSEDGPVLGVFEGEREPADTIFGFNVPQAGLYPMRLVYYQARGGGSVRWFSVTPSGEQILINDPENPVALKAFRSTTETPVTSTRITVTRTGASTVLTWSGGGTLETSTTLAPNSWNPVTNGSSPYPLPTTGTHAFFRVVQ